MSTADPEMLSRFLPDIQALEEVGALFYQRGWSVGTSSNYSVLLQREPCQLLITASGKDKGRLGHGDFVVVDHEGQPIEPNQPKSSAETLLHIVAAQQPGVGAVLHTHSVWGTLLSDLFYEEGQLIIEGYEMLKGLAGIRTHATQVAIEIFENTQDIPALADQVKVRLNGEENGLRYGFLIRRHGLYTWGQDLDEARRHIEVLEFLFEVVGRRLIVTGTIPASLVD